MTAGTPWSASYENNAVHMAVRSNNGYFAAADSMLKNARASDRSRGVRNDRCDM
jgi:hypothetical protein